MAARSARRGSNGRATNGSIASWVEALAAAGGQTTLTVSRIGRDQVLRFRVGDWVTVTDDHRELMDGSCIVAIGNHLRAQQRYLSFDFHGNRRTVLMGNVTQGPVLQHPNPVPAPPESFNILGCSPEEEARMSLPGLEELLKAHEELSERGRKMAEAAARHP